MVERWLLAGMTMLCLVFMGTLVRMVDREMQPVLDRMEQVTEGLRTR